MISKQLRILSTVLAIMGLCLFFIFQYFLQPTVLGGFNEGTEQYNGYRYAQDNQLKSEEQCDDEKDDPEMHVNQEFLEGCKRYFHQ
ncbi:hypothetical protein [Acinetobacter bouvetii]|uniref:Uncharacterized protein n=1 Tax=Acinetobacter bouvetii TaxID=202951 RepID=A0A811GD20_9GAMM|nr:hypothetical protein [Acinetobacter bouvetii]CAB1221400.1 hypothetical protein SFB21_2775 [Acinetobacter bouvetii]